MQHSAQRWPFYWTLQQSNDRYKAVFQAVGERTRPPNPLIDFSKTQLTITWLNYQVQKKVVILNQYYLLTSSDAFACFLCGFFLLAWAESFSVKSREEQKGISQYLVVTMNSETCTFSPHRETNAWKAKKADLTMPKVTSALETRELELPAEGEVLYCYISQLLLLYSVHWNRRFLLHPLSPGIQPQ